MDRKPIPGGEAKVIPEVFLEHLLCAHCPGGLPPVAARCQARRPGVREEDSDCHFLKMVFIPVMMKWTLTLLVASAFLPVQAAEPSIKLDLGGGVLMELVRVEAGTFTQGSPATEAGRGADEQQRKVNITQPFYMGRYPVTRAQWERFAAEKNYRTEAEDGVSGGFGWDGQKLTQRKDFTWRTPGFSQTGEHPVTLVTWPDAQAYLKWLGTRTGKTCALPTEAQWEYACRAGTATPWPLTGGADDWAWYRANAMGSTHPVGQKKPNAWGLSDMGGQVWEWCQDWYGPWDANAVTDPLQTNDKLSDKPRRVLRGGSFIKDANSARSAARYRNDPRSRNADNGFRVVVLERAGTAPAIPPVKPQSTPLPAEAPENTAGIKRPAPVNTVPSAPVPPPPVRAPVSVVDPPARSGMSGWFWLVFGFFGLMVVWQILRRVFANSRGQSRQSFQQWSSGQGGGGAGAMQPALTTRLVNDGFWIRGALPSGTPVFWRWRMGDQLSQGQTAFEPGPEGMFIFTGTLPDSAEAWLGDATPADDPSWGPGSLGGLSGYRTGLGAGMLQDQLQREQERERQRQRDRDEDERRRRRDEEDSRRHSTPVEPAHRYPSAY